MIAIVAIKIFVSLKKYKALFQHQKKKNTAVLFSITNC